MTSLLILGGTGIVGRATVKVALDNGFDVTVTGIEENPDLVKRSRFVHKSQLDSLEDISWDAVFDVYAFNRKDSQRVYDKFKNRANHFFVLSSTLVYDRSGFSFERIFSDHQKAKKGSQGGYVDKKLEVENFWENKGDVNWTVLRPYHIIGSGSYLGCLPPHNRDPQLLERIQAGEIELCDGGRIPLNIVNPKDIGKVVVDSVGNSQTYKRLYNVVNPQEIIARDYYQKIAEILGVDLNIKNISGEDVWSRREWTLTTLPHLYDTADLEKDVGYVPSIGLEESLRETIDNCPLSIQERETFIFQRMHTKPCLDIHNYFPQKTKKFK